MSTIDSLKVTIIREKLFGRTERESTFIFGNFADELFAGKSKILDTFPELKQYCKVKFYWIDDQSEEILVHDGQDLYAHMNKMVELDRPCHVYVKGLKQ